MLPTFLHAHSRRADCEATLSGPSAELDETYLSFLNDAWAIHPHNSYLSVCLSVRLLHVEAFCGVHGFSSSILLLDVVWELREQAVRSLSSFLLLGFFT